MFCPVPHDQIDLAITKLRPLLKKFADQDINQKFFSVADLIQDLKCGHYTLWLLFEEQDVIAYLTTHIWQTSKTKVCEIRSCAGDLGDGHEYLYTHLPSIEEWGREHGCHTMYIRGRKGWAKLLPDYETEMIVLSKELI